MSSENNIEEVLKSIRTDCRLAMNGVVSTSMRQLGMDYKLNFGLLIAQIKALAAKYGPSSLLANRLWREDTRELKILATMIYPIDEFSKEQANSWVNEISNQEIREQVCINLFQELPFAKELALGWISSAKEDVRTTGYWLLARLLLAKKNVGILQLSDLGVAYKEDIISKQLFLRNASLLVLKHMARQSKSLGLSILEDIRDYKNNPDPLKEEAYDSISFEIEFIFG